MTYRCDTCGEHEIDSITTACPQGCHLRGYAESEEMREDATIMEGKLA